MCGRYTLAVNVNVLQSLFGLDERPPGAPAANMGLPRFNIAPTQPVLIVREDRDGKRRASWAKWGLIPERARDPRVGARMINARAETVFQQPAFREAVRRRRCLLPTDGFFEWKKLKDRKQPYHVRTPDHRVWAMAGIWSRWRDEAGQQVDTCSVLTTASNETLSDLHTRMPVLVAPEQYDLWLDPAEVVPEALQGLLVPASQDALVMVPVATTVNSVKNQDESCLEEISEADARAPVRLPQLGFGF